MQIYKAEKIENGIVWTTYEENGQTFPGRGFRREDWKVRAAAQRRYLSAQRKWAAADARYTRNMKEARYAIVNHLGWSDARLGLREDLMRKALADMREAARIMREAREEVDAL